MAAYPVAAGRCFCRCSIGRRVSRRTASLRTTPVRRWVNSIRQLSATVSRSTAWLSRSSPGRMQPEVKNSHRLFSDGRSLGIVRQLAGRLRTNLAAWSLPRNTHARHARGGDCGFLRGRPAQPSGSSSSCWRRAACSGMHLGSHEASMSPSEIRSWRCTWSLRRNELSFIRTSGSSETTW